MWASHKNSVVSEASTLNSEFVCSNCVPEQLQYSLRFVQDSVMIQMHHIGRMSTSSSLIHMDCSIQTELTCSFIDMSLRNSPSILDNSNLSIGLIRQPDRNKIIPRSQLVAERQQAVALVEQKVKQYCLDHQDEILKLLSEQESEYESNHYWMD